MLLLLNLKGHTGTLHSGIDAFQHAPFTTISRYLGAKIAQIERKTKFLFYFFNPCIIRHTFNECVAVVAVLQFQNRLYES